MSMPTQLLLSVVAAATLGAPQAADAAASDPLACSIAVTTTLNSVATLAYTRDFTVSTTTPFSDDFSTATRLRFFDASVTIEAGTPVVAIQLDADVSVFDTVDFSTSLKLRDAHGETTSGTSSFFTSNRAIRTEYTLTCARAR
jgi:hypothetical protein